MQSLSKVGDYYRMYKLHRWFRKWPGLVMAATLAGALSGCATSHGDEHLLDFLQDGKTTREDVFLHLGPPSTTFEGGRILTYRVDRDKGGYIVSVAKQKEWYDKFSLVLAFDQNGIVRRHSLVRVRSVFVP